MSDFIKSDYCTECDGDGKIFVRFETGFNPKVMECFDKDVFEQCFECERLHNLEVVADRMHDSDKGD